MQVGNNPNINKTNNEYKNYVPVNSSYIKSVNVGQKNPVLTLQAASAIKSNVMAQANINYTYLGPVDLPNLQPAGMYQLNTGQKVVIVPKKGPTTVRTFVKVGSFNEPDSIRGISHYIEHNLFNGSDHLKEGEFVKRVNNMGAKYNASTGFLTTDYFITSPMHKSTDLDEIITMHADMVNNPLYKANMLLKEKGPVTSEIQMLSDNPYNISNNTIIKNLFNIKTTSMDIIGGTVDNILNLKRNQVVDYYNKWYTPDNMTTVVVGDVNPDKVIGKISREFSKGVNTAPAKAIKYYEPIVPIESSKRIDIKNPMIKSALVSVGFSGPKNNDIKGTVATEALIYALSGIKTGKLIQKLKPYNVIPNMGIEPVSARLDDPQLLMFQADFRPGEEEKGLKDIYSTINEMAYKPISNKMLSTIKIKLKGSLADVAESSMGITNVIGHSILDHGSIDAYSKREQIIESLTAQDLQNAAQNFLNLNKASICVLHPQDQIIGQSKNSKVSFSGNVTNLSNSASIAAPYINQIKEYKLANNMYVALSDTPNTNKATAAITLDLSDFAKTKPGVANLLGKMIDYNTRRYNEYQLSNVLDSNDISISSNATQAALGFAIDTSKEKMPLALDYVNEILFNPAFTQMNLDRAKKEIKLAYMSSTKSPVDRAIETLYPITPYGNSTRKIVENLDNITVADVQNLYSRLIKNARAKAVISGQIGDNNFVNQVFGKLQSTPHVYQIPQNVEAYKETPITKSYVITEADDRNQANIIQAFKIKKSGNIKDEAAMYLMNEVLGGNSQSRLFNDLREKQKLAYRVNSSYSSDDRTGELVLNIQTTTENGAEGNQFDNVKKSIDGFKKHLDLLKTQPIPKDELEGAKLSIISKLVSSTESSLGKTAMISSGLDTIYGSKYCDKLIDAINNTSAKDIQTIANYYLNKPSVISMVAGKNTIVSNKDYLAKFGEVKSY